MRLFGWFRKKKVHDPPYKFGYSQMRISSSVPPGKIYGINPKYIEHLEKEILYGETDDE